ncbi:MAG: hypothetical protein M3Z41_09885 [Candidatus Eremiobacteraeota bacterium]|nr:hypothetical protein [Candidatus Eremiobacteraeota bacterium]
MIRLLIEPQPSPEVAAAIEAAVKVLMAGQATSARRLRFGHVGPAKVGSGDTFSCNDRLAARGYRWSEVARIEALDASLQ